MFCLMTGYFKIAVPIAGTFSVWIVGYLRFKHVNYKIVPLLSGIDPKSWEEEQKWAIFLVPILLAAANVPQYLFRGDVTSDPYFVALIVIFLLSVCLWALIEGVRRIRLTK